MNGFQDFWKGLVNAWQHHSVFQRPAVTLWFFRTWWLQNKKLLQAKQANVLYFGPVYSEFGHVLLHILPFLAYAHYKLGIEKIVVCTNQVYKPLFDFVFPKAVCELISLPDHIGAYTPSVNKLPEGIDAEMKNSIIQFQNALESHNGFDLLDGKAYWYVFRNWHLANKHQYLPPIKSDSPTPESKPKVMIFPRKKGAEYTANNGGPWDYPLLVNKLLDFAQVVVAGHPNLSVSEGYSDHPDLSFAWDNQSLLNESSTCQLIITQHSGACILGDYVGVDTLILFNGTPPIKGLDETMRFRRHIQKGNFYFAHNLEEVDAFLIKRFKLQHETT
ncbi:MAG: hypothetical protein WEC59_07370 [Salibacteraceae bacterium]